MRLDEQSIDDAADRPKRGFPNQHVFHYRPVGCFAEFVSVPERPKPALGHIIDKSPRPFKLDDLDGHPMPHAEMSAFKRDRLSQHDLAVLHSLDRPFIRDVHRLSVQADVTHEVKANVGRSVDMRLEDYRCHRDQLGRADG